MATKKKATPASGKRRTVAQAEAENAALRERLIEATIRHTKENELCTDGAIEFLSEVLNVDEDDLEVEWKKRTTHTVAFSLKLTTTQELNYDTPDYECLESLEFAEIVTDYLGFAPSGNLITGNGRIQFIEVTPIEEGD